MARHTVRSLANERRLATSACAPTIMPPGKLDGTDREHDEFTTDVYEICIGAESTFDQAFLWLNIHFTEGCGHILVQPKSN